jgi:hypothetical protein
VERHTKRARGQENRRYILAAQGGLAARRKYLIDNCPEFSQAIEAERLLEALYGKLSRDDVGSAARIYARLLRLEEASASRQTHDATCEGRENIETVTSGKKHLGYKFIGITKERRNLQAGISASLALVK